MPSFIVGDTPSFDSGVFDDGPFDGASSTGPLLHGPVVSGALAETFILGGVNFDLGPFDVGIFDGPSTGPILAGVLVGGALHYVPLPIVLAGDVRVPGFLMVGGTLFYMPGLPMVSSIHDQDLGRFGIARGDHAIPTVSVVGAANDPPVLVGSARGT